MIRFEEVSKNYYDKKILEKINININSGEFVLLVGDNGQVNQHYLSYLVMLYILLVRKSSKTKCLMLIYQKNFHCLKH